MIKSLYGKYFQKSRSFLYPALGIKKSNKFTPLNTYLAVKGAIGAEDSKLICTFKKDDSKDFELFEINMLLENPLFLKKIELEEILLYVFDFQIYQNDWFNFILGKYSRLSNVLKRAIKNYYGPNSVEYEYMDSYLHPEEYFSLYSNLLDVEATSLKQIGELCDACDVEKETLEVPEKYLEELRKLV